MAAAAATEGDKNTHVGPTASRPQTASLPHKASVHQAGVFDAAPRRRSGQATIEFALLYAGVILPLTFMTIFAAEILWVWHSAIEFTRDGARYAATHCWQADAGNVTTYMQSHVPRMIDMDQFQSGAAGIQVQYFAKDPDSGELVEFSCEGGECSVDCIPDAVSVSITNYQFTRFSSYMRLPAVTMPPFRASLPVESGGCDEGGNCLP